MMVGEIIRHALQLSTAPADTVDFDPAVKSAAISVIKLLPTLVGVDHVMLPGSVSSSNDAPEIIDRLIHREVVASWGLVLSLNPEASEHLVSAISDAARKSALEDPSKNGCVCR